MKLDTGTVADLTAVAALSVFAVVVWWPSLFLVVAVAALSYSYRRSK